MIAHTKRLIEVDLPIKRISAHARREKSIRHGHISTLHIWWARRPLAACRAVICASLWPDPADPLCPDSFRQVARREMQKWATQHIGMLGEESFKRFNYFQKNPKMLDDNEELRNALLDFIADFANWDNSTTKEYLETSRALTQAAHEALGGEPGTWPLVLDPFAGGGAFPVEAARIGANSIGVDLNPLAAVLNKIILEYIPTFGQSLVDALKHWGAETEKRLEKRLRRLYPRDKDGAEPICYFWARTIRCEGPACGVVVPVIRNFNFAQRAGNEAAVIIEYNGRTLNTQLATGSTAKKIKGGTSQRSAVTCPRCGYTTSQPNVAKQANRDGFGFHLFAVCIRSTNGIKKYREPNSNDLKAISIADHELENWQSKEFDGVPAIPHEELPYLRSIFNVRVYGMDEWCKLFTPRQLLSAIIHVDVVREISSEIKSVVSDKSLAEAIITSLGLTVSNGLQYQCNIATYLSDGIVSAFIQGQSLGMKMDFVEANPIMPDLVGGFNYSLKKHLSGLEYLSTYSYPKGTAIQGSALHDLMPESSCSLVATDPPYYDVVPYADCSDFFYVWLRRMWINSALHDFKSTLTPKDEEIVQLAERNERYKVRTKSWFESKMRDALERIRVTLPEHACAVIVFAHKATAAWEALLQSVLGAGWIVTASWPIDTEKETRMRANASAVLGSSIHLVCRPRGKLNGSVGDWREVLAELPKRIHEWMPRLAKEGVVGADAIFACLGPALEIFSRYSRVEKASGEQVTLKEYLEHVWSAVAKEALDMIFEGADATGFEEDARLTAIWLWTLRTEIRNGAKKNDDGDEDEDGENGNGKKKSLGGYVLEYDAARKIAQGLGIHLERLESLVEIKGETARLLPVEERARYLFGNDSIETVTKRKKKDRQMTVFEILEESDEITP